MSEISLLIINIIFSYYFFFNIVIKHIKGRDNRRADAISRRPDLMYSETEVVENLPIIETDD